MLNTNLLTSQVRAQAVTLLARATVLLGGATLLSGCGSSLAMDGSLSAAQIRFVQVSPGGPEMDFYVNGAGAAYNVGFANFTSYLPVSPGQTNLAVHKAGASQTVSAADGLLSGGHQYTAVAVHGLGNLQQRIYADQDTPAPSGQVALRVLNELEGAGSITVYVTPVGEAPGAPPAAVVTTPAGAASAYVVLPAAGSYSVTATIAQGVLNVPLATASVKAVSGAVRSVVFGGVAQAGGHGAVGFVLNDADAP